MTDEKHHAEVAANTPEVNAMDGEKRVRVTVLHGDGSSTLIHGRPIEVPRGKVTVVCDTCPPDDKGMRVGFWVDVLDPRLPDGPFSCDECMAVGR